MTDIQSPSPRFSRYRSVRQAATSRTGESSGSSKQDGTPDITIQRSMSRYRKRPASSTNNNATLDGPPNPSVPQQFASNNPYRSSGERGVSGSANSKPQNIPLAHADDDEMRQTRRLALNDLQAREHSRMREVESAQRRDLETSRQQQRKDHDDAIRHQREVDKAAETVAKQKRKELARLEQESNAAAKSTRPGRPTPTKDIFSFFGRKRQESKMTDRFGPGPDATPTSSVNMISRADRTTAADELPGADAPISAVNAGERRVLVRYKQSSINLPVTLETTPVSLAHAAAKSLSGIIDPSSMVVLESYTKLGLQRRVRRYEHIREIMNSWDRDTQNAIILEQSTTSGHDADLQASAVPTQPPVGLEVYMYHSLKPGKWNKRYVTLNVTGQIYIAKKPSAKFSDKDIVNICHLSDFDIFIPTPQQLRKTLKPPRKHCYAIKSQQKTTMFLNTENFVHFFCTDDTQMADEWYEAVQQWRSWYLLRKVGQTQKQTHSQALVGNAGHFAQDGTTRPAEADEHYTTDALKSLALRPHSRSPISPTSSEDDENRPRQIPFHLRNNTLLSPTSSFSPQAHPPLGSSPRRDLLSSSNTPIHHPPSTNGETFAATGLLGRTYTQREQRAAQQNNGTKDAEEGPFITGPSLLNNTHAFDPFSSRPPTSGNNISRRLSVSSKRPGSSAGPGSTGLQRSSSKRVPHMPAPLVDLTPKFVEAPQWRTEGKGHGVPAPKGVLLVDVANTPDLGGDGPKPTVFRREENGRLGSLGRSS